MGALPIGSSEANFPTRFVEIPSATHCEGSDPVTLVQPAGTVSKHLPRPCQQARICGPAVAIGTDEVVRWDARTNCLVSVQALAMRRNEVVQDGGTRTSGVETFAGWEDGMQYVEKVRAASKRRSSGIRGERGGHVT